MKRFKQFLDEKRRNPISKLTGKELNPKVSLYDALEPLSNDSDVYISYVSDVGAMSKSAEGFKIGVNPKSEFNTPNGIYSYPLQQAWKTHRNPVDKTLDVPFAGENPFVYIFKPKASGKIVDLKKYSSSDYDKDYDKLAKMIIKFYKTKNKMSEYIGWESAKSILDAASKNTRNKSIGGQFWNMTRYTFFCLTSQLSTKFIDEYEEELIDGIKNKRKRANFSDKTIRFSVMENIKRSSKTNLWNKIFRDLGYHGVADKSNAGIIHPSEPTQAVFFNSAFIKVIGGVYNKNYQINKFGSGPGVKNFPKQYSLLSNKKEIQEIVANYLSVHGTYAMKVSVIISMLKSIIDKFEMTLNKVYLKNTTELELMTDPDYADNNQDKIIKSRIQFFTTDNEKLLELNSSGGAVYMLKGWNHEDFSKKYVFNFNDIEGSAFLMKFKQYFMSKITRDMKTNPAIINMNDFNWEDEIDYDSI